MIIIRESSFAVFWKCPHTWRRSTINTLWCLLGCSIGDFGTIGFFQLAGISWPSNAIFALAMINGVLTSIGLESIILSKQMGWKSAFKVACGMSLISMFSMELAMNLVDVAVHGSAKLSFGILPWMLLAGFITPLPYNYWRLKALGRACH